VVEDERAIQLALGLLLKREGYEVTLASSGDEAVAKLDDDGWDLVLTDLALGKRHLGHGRPGQSPIRCRATSRW
jgi:DNA-binding response OmpR family regulator